MPLYFVTCFVDDRRKVTDFLYCHKWRQYHILSVECLDTSAPDHKYIMPWECFPHYWPFARGIYGISFTEGQQRGVLMFLCHWPKQLERAVELLVIWYTKMYIWRHCDVIKCKLLMANTLELLKSCTKPLVSAVDAQIVPIVITGVSKPLCCRITRNVTFICEFISIYVYITLQLVII